MDPITHAALGAATAQAVLYKRNNPNIWLVGALAAMAPDLDIFINSAGNPMRAILFHRNFTHSLFFIPLGAGLVALGLMLFKRFRKNGGLIFLAALLGYATHGLLDACTSYGTMLYWPFSISRVSWDFIAIIDPFFTIPLILGVVWTTVHNNRKGVLLGLGLAGLFLLFNVFQHSKAMVRANKYGEQQHLQIRKFRVFPHLASSTHWRTAIIAEQQIHIADVFSPLFKQARIVPVGIFPLFEATELPFYVQKLNSQRNDFSIFKWFCDGYVILVNQQPLILADGRYLFNSKPAIAMWGIQFIPKQPHVNFLNFIKLEEI